MHRQLNASQLLGVRRRISARAVCSLRGSAADIAVCGKLWMQNADDVSVAMCFCCRLPLTLLWQLASALQRVAALDDADVTSQHLIVV